MYKFTSFSLYFSFTLYFCFLSCLFFLINFFLKFSSDYWGGGKKGVLPPILIIGGARARAAPQSLRLCLGPPRFLVGLVQKSRTKVLCTNSISIVRGGFCPGSFVRVGFR